MNDALEVPDDLRDNVRWEAGRHAHIRQRVSMRAVGLP